MPRTDHSGSIAQLRSVADLHLEEPSTEHSKQHALNLQLAADLLELHDDTGISLDAWDSARQFVERYIGASIQENHV